MKPYSILTVVCGNNWFDSTFVSVRQEWSMIFECFTNFANPWVLMPCHSIDSKSQEKVLDVAATSFAPCSLREAIFSIDSFV